MFTLTGEHNLPHINDIITKILTSPSSDHPARCFISVIYHWYKMLSDLHYHREYVRTIQGEDRTIVAITDFLNLHHHNCNKA